MSIEYVLCCNYCHLTNGDMSFEFLPRSIEVVRALKDGTIDEDKDAAYSIYISHPQCEKDEYERLDAEMDEAEEMGPESWKEDV